VHRVYHFYILSHCRWGRVTLLEALSKYHTTDVKDAEHICERVVPQFQHQNASVVMAAVKVIMLNLNTVGVEMQKSLVKKMGPPLGILSVLFLINSSDDDLLSPRSAICRFTQHQSYSTKTARHSQQRMENICKSQLLYRANIVLSI
jgi:hypothetical protein